MGGHELPHRGQHVKAYAVPVAGGWVQVQIPDHSGDLNPYTFQQGIIGRLGVEGKNRFWDLYFGEPNSIIVSFQQAPEDD